MAATPQWKLRRLASRATRVYERRAGDAPALRAFENTLVPVARDFITTYDGVKRYDTTWQKEMREGHGAVSSLIGAIRTWLPRLSVDIPHFDRSTFADTSVPDDVIEDAERLRDTVEAHQELAQQEGNALTALPYAGDLLGQLLPAYEAAQKEWREAEEANAQYQQTLAKTRGLAGQLQQELVAFRETLATVVGRSHVDYQKLRDARAAAPDPEDDPNAPVAAPATESASAG